MREHPWHIRRTNHTHVLGVQMLGDLHTMTLDALLSLNIDVEEFTALLPPSRDKELLKTLSQGLDHLWDDTLPENLISRLGAKIASLQAHLISRSKKENTLELLLESAVSSGASAARRRWPDLKTTDLRSIAATLRNHPFSPLLKRAMPTELLVHYRNCPHLSPQLSPQHTGEPVLADELCDFHFHWIHGYVSALCPERTLRITRESRQPCIQSWQNWQPCQTVL